MLRAVALALWLVGTASAQSVETPAPDTVATGTPAVAVPADSVATDSLPTPGEALRRSLLVPGWGQRSNRQTAKVPVVAAAVVGAVAYAVVRQRQYTRYRRAAFYAGCVAEPDREVCADAASAEDEWLGLGSPPFAAVSPVRDRIRGQRDVAVLLVGVVYALQALDAYVAAHLADFDVTEDLSLRVAPGPGGPALAARWRL